MARLPRGFWGGGVKNTKDSCEKRSKKGTRTPSVGLKDIGTGTGEDSEDEVFTSAYGTGEKSAPADTETENPFFRRPSLARTPPQRREEPLQRERSRDEDKRKRSSGSPPDTAKKLREAGEEKKEEGEMPHRCEKMIKKISNLIRKVDERVGNLHNITSGSRNTKVEIKDLAEELTILMKTLTGLDIGSLAAREVGRTQTKEVATQTEQSAGLRSRRMGSTAEEVLSLEGHNTMAGWQEIVKKRWSPTLLKRTEIKEGSDFLLTRDSVTKVVTTLKDMDDDRNKRIWREERFPELQTSQDDFAVLEQTIRLRGETDNRPVKKIKIVTDGSDEDPIWVHGYPD